jgi:hypothetical protein
MKRATFLFILIVISCSMSLKELKAEEFSFSGFTISLEETVIDGEGKIIVTKGGINPFETVIGIEGYHLYYNGVSMYEEYFVIYGYTLDNQNNREYDGFFYVLDKDGDVILGEEGLLDYGFREDVKNVYTFDHRLMVEVKQSTDNDYQVSVMKHIFLLYNESLELIQEHSISENIKEISVKDKILLGRYQTGDLFDFGILSSGELIWKDDHIGVNDGEVYYNEVCLNFINQVTLNDEIITDDICIDVIGTHFLTYNDQMITFEIEPIIEGVADGSIYYEPVTISFNGGYATLNGDSFANHQEIVDIGQYVFVVEGLNDYKKEVHFEIGSVVEGITNNTTYEENVTIEFTGQGYLNNQYVTSPVTVNNDGEYIFKIKGKDGYVESYYFTIESVKEKNRLLDFIQKVDVFVLGTVLILGIVVIKKKR